MTGTFFSGWSLYFSLVCSVTRVHSLSRLTAGLKCWFFLKWKFLIPTYQKQSILVRNFLTKTNVVWSCKVQLTDIKKEVQQNSTQPRCLSTSLMHSQHYLDLHPLTSMKRKQDNQMIVWHSCAGRTGITIILNSCASSPFRSNQDGTCRSWYGDGAYHQHYRDHQDAYGACLIWEFKS